MPKRKVVTPAQGIKFSKREKCSCNRNALRTTYHQARKAHITRRGEQNLVDMVSSNASKPWIVIVDTVVYELSVVGFAESNFEQTLKSWDSPATNLVLQQAAD